jgi:hypothetical protein
MRPVHEIATDIIQEIRKRRSKGVRDANWIIWSEPYLQAMTCISTKNDIYGQDDGYGLIAYCLGNLSGFRGELAKKLKNELKEHLE